MAILPFPIDYFAGLNKLSPTLTSVTYLVWMMRSLLILHSGKLELGTSLSFLLSVHQFWMNITVLWTIWTWCWPRLKWLTTHFSWKYPQSLNTYVKSSFVGYCIFTDFSSVMLAVNMVLKMWLVTTVSFLQTDRSSTQHAHFDSLKILRFHYQWCWWMKHLPMGHLVHHQLTMLQVLLSAASWLLLLASSLQHSTEGLP